MINNNEYRFGIVPEVTTPRSKFLMHQNIRTTFNAGLLIPFYVDQSIMPGDTFKLSGTFVIRQSTPIYPTMDNSFADIFFVRVPIRLIWTHFKQFMGENDTGAWTQQTEYEVPKIALNRYHNSCVEKGDTLNYMGVPITKGLRYDHQGDEIRISALPIRAYQLTWNEWFRDENVCPPYFINKDETEMRPYHYTGSGQGTLQDQYWGKYTPNGQNTRFDPLPAPVFKYKDYFNSCLPSPQKGDAVTLPLGQTAPIDFYANNPDNNATVAQGDKIYLNNYYTTNTDVGPSRAGAGTDDESTDTGTQGFFNIQAFADLSNAVAATVNAQRLAFATQRILEQAARTGTRYTEIIRGFFGVTSPDARQQRPEILCSRRIPITMTQVAQTSSTDSTSPQGNVAAYSLTVDSNHLCTFSNTEHCIVLGLICIRQEHSYDQGLQRDWTKFKKLDWYWPQLAFIGEQPIYNREIMLTGVQSDGTSTDGEVFGYNERWAELRYKPNINTGAFSTQYAQSLDSWHYGDSYNSLPVLSFEWRKETKDYIDRTLAVQSNVEDQYLMDCRIEIEATRPIPMFSVPGLLDHF